MSANLRWRTLEEQAGEVYQAAASVVEFIEESIAFMIDDNG